MKIRQGFVSNSSSSSFICDISGYTDSGWDMSLYEAGMIQCEKGHTFLESYAEDVEAQALQLFLDKVFEKYPDEFSDDMDEEELEDLAYNFGFRYEFPEKFCPLCSFRYVTDKDALAFLMKMEGYDSKEAVSELMKSKFNLFSEFKEYIKG